MLKSTYRQSAPAAAPDPLPPGWTEHKAPTGHAYYYHAETQTSTYTRPTVPSDEPLQIDYGATEPDHVVRASMQAMDQFNRNNASGPGQFTGRRSHQEHARRRGHQGDRPKSKAPIPDCAPWLLVKTKLGRRFVHNTETKQSLWKFPQDVMMAVIEMDRREWEANKKEQDKPQDKERDGQLQEEQPNDQPASSTAQERPAAEGYDSDSYEEVEVTDDEGEDDADPSAPKRPRLSDDRHATPPPAGPVEFNEDDIAWQLAQMEGGYSDQYDDDDEERPDDIDGDGDDRSAERDEGLPLTASDNLALFRSLLDDSRISPYSVFEKVIEDMAIVEDPRYVALPNTSSRKDAFLQWSRDRIAEAQAQKKHEEQQSATSQSKLAEKDPKVQYLRLLHRQATPKLYWPEFKRKFKREHAMKDPGLQDKEREKLYREYISKMKLADAERRKELVAFLKAAEITTHVKDLEELPLAVVRDLRFYLVDERRRDELVRTFLETAR